MKGNVAQQLEPGVRIHKEQGFNWMKMIFVVVFMVTVFIVLVPLIMLLYSSFASVQNRMPFEGFHLSLDNYIKVLMSPTTYNLLWDTMVFTVGSTAIGISVAVILAWIVERTTITFKPIIYALIMVPMAIPSMIYAISWTQLLGPKTGLINVVLQNLFGLENGPLNVYSLGGMLFVQGIAMVPTVFLMIAATFTTLDPSLEEQSAICGRGLLQTIRRVTLPLLKPSLLSAIIFFTIVAVESFEIPVTLGLTARIPLLSSQIFFAAHPITSGLPDYGLASTLGVILLIFALILVYIYQRMTRNAQRFETITGKGYRPRKIELKKWKLLSHVFVWFYIFLTVLLPFLILIWTSLHPFYMTPSIQSLKSSTLVAYKQVLTYPELDHAIWNTLVMSLASGIITIVLVSLIAWFVVRGPFSKRARQTLDTLSFLPLAVPAVVVGLSLTFVYISIPLPIYGTLWILIIGMVTKYIAFGTRTMISAQVQISRELEEASQISGASWLRTIRKIQMPLLTPALLNCFIWVVVHAMRELSLVIMLYSPKSMVLSTIIWNMWEGGSAAKASVLGVFLIIVLGVIFFGGQKFANHLVKTR